MRVRRVLTLVLMAGALVLGTAGAAEAHAPAKPHVSRPPTVQLWHFWS